MGKRIALRGYGFLRLERFLANKVRRGIPVDSALSWKRMKQNQIFDRLLEDVVYLDEFWQHIFHTSVRALLNLLSPPWHIDLFEGKAV